MADKEHIVGQISLFGPPETPDTFRKAVQVVHSKPKKPLSLIQRKIGNAWLRHALVTDSDSQGWWSVNLRQLAADIGFDSNNRQHLKEAAEALMSIVFEWDVIAPAARRALWKASVMFPEVELHSDVVRYQFSSQMREALLNPEIYALIDMNVVRKFRRASSLAIWEHCIRYEKIGHTGEVEWQLFRDMILGEDKSNTTYQEYKFFKSKVLKPALSEITATSEHEVKMIEKKIGRRVSTLQFTIKRKKSAQTETPETLEVMAEVTKFGVPLSEARRIVRNEPHSAIKGALAYTKARLADRKLSKLENPAAYFRKALEGRYQVDDSVGPKEAAKPAVDIRGAFEARRMSEADEYFRELDPEDQFSLIERYDSQQPIETLRLTGKKKPGKAAQATFFGWLAKVTWGEPTPEELLTFAQEFLVPKQ